MTKRALVMRIAEETGLSQHQVLAVIQKTLDYIIDSLVAGKTVELREFGVFEVRTRRARVGRNPRKPKIAVAIPPRRVVKFKPGRRMRAEVSNPPAAGA